VEVFATINTQELFVALRLVIEHVISINRDRPEDINMASD
jgi:hypothetical protein